MLGEHRAGAPTRARARASLFMLSGLLACFFLRGLCCPQSRVLEHPYRFRTDDRTEEFGLNSDKRRMAGERGDVSWVSRYSRCE